jgi:hypothetical protein
MSSETPKEVAAPEEPYDAEGVDRSLIRELLDLTPIERVRRVESVAQSVLLLRELNGIPRAR